MRFLSLIAASLFVQSSLGLSVPEFNGEYDYEKRGLVLCTLGSTETQPGGYYLLQNAWTNLISGSQCSQVTSLGTGPYGFPDLVWWTKYSWTSGSGVIATQPKAFPDISLLEGLPRQVYSISQIPTSWNWTYTSASDKLIADVSYKLNLTKSAYSPTSAPLPDVQVNVWLSSRGGDTPFGTLLGSYSIGSFAWELYYDTASFFGIPEVWTFRVIKPSTEITVYLDDLFQFLLFLINNYGLNKELWLVQLGAGGEPIQGDAYINTTEYSVGVI